MIFPEIMAEMRRPRDFIKGMAVAQLLIIVSVCPSRMGPSFLEEARAFQLTFVFSPFFFLSFQTAYLLYGIFVYSYQGQYTLALAYQGVSKYS